jgi:hypothetical protein
MKIIDIQPGKTYRKSRVQENLNQKPTYEYKIYVLDKNDSECKVLASIGGAPSKWYDMKEYRNWKIQDQKQIA